MLMVKERLNKLCEKIKEYSEILVFDIKNLEVTETGYKKGHTPPADVTVNDGFREVYLCDMMENELEKLGFCNNRITVPFKIFEIITLKFKR